jgi:cobalt-zinc-cadmium efflux system protein
VFDALTSFAVVCGAIVIYFTHLNWLDPLLSLIITLFILKNSLKLFKHTLDLSLDGVPKNMHKVRNIMHFSEETEECKTNTLERG